MAVSSSADVPPPERLRLVRRLGARGARTWAAIESLGDGKTRVVVVEKIERGGERGDTEIADWLRDVRRLATLEHPNLGRVRDVSIRGDEVLVTSDYIDGARWSELGATSPRPALETALRVLVDVLSGLSVMHNLRDDKRQPVKLVHGNLTPDCVIVGLDGLTRLVLPCRVRAEGLQADRAGSAYLAPEILLGDESADARADVYSVGAMLWEALSGTPLFAGLQPSAIVTQLLSGRVPKATLPEGCAWAAPLVEAASRAMSADPEKRFGSAAAMAAEIRRIATVKLPPAMRVAGYVRGAHGDRIRARRQEIERGETRESGPPPAIDVDFDEDAEARSTAVPDPGATNTSTTRPPPPIEAPPVVVAPAPPPAVIAVETPFMAFAPAMAPAPPPPKPSPPRAPPPIRARHATLAGVAPPAVPAEENTGPGTPVVVPSSRPPSPPARVEAAVEVPRLAPVPADLVREVALETRGAAPEPLAPSPVPAMPPMVMPLDEPPPVPPARRRKVPVALVGAVLGVFGLAAVIWWLALRGPQQADATPAPPPSESAVATAPPLPPPAAPTPTPVASVTAAPSATLEPEATPPVAAASATAAASDIPAPEASTAPVAAPPPTAPPVMPARPQRPRYEPEGI